MSDFNVSNIAEIVRKGREGRDMKPYDKIVAENFFLRCPSVKSLLETYELTLKLDFEALERNAITVLREEHETKNRDSPKFEMKTTPLPIVHFGVSAIIGPNRNRFAFERAVEECGKKVEELLESELAAAAGVQTAKSRTTGEEVLKDRGYDGPYIMLWPKGKCYLVQSTHDCIRMIEGLAPVSFFSKGELKIATILVPQIRPNIDNAFGVVRIV